MCFSGYLGVSPVAHTVKNPSAMQETQVQSLGWEDPLEKGMAAQASILAWRTPWTEKSGGLQSMGSQSQTRLSNKHPCSYVILFSPSHQSHEVDTLTIILQMRQGTEMLSNSPGFAQLINDRTKNRPWSA